MWDKEVYNSGSGSWPQRFSVGAPEAGAGPNNWQNYEILIPAGFGDMFCAGHCWMPDGRLFVAGGTTQYPNPSGSSPSNFLGSKLVGIWDPALVNIPPDFGWTFPCAPSSYNKPLFAKRWYPTVTLLGNNQIVVAGGVEDTAHVVCGASPNDGAVDTYEIWDIASNDWVRQPGTAVQVWPGPDYAGLGNCYSVFGEYPRQHLLSSGHLFVAGMFTGANRAHAMFPGVWLPYADILDSFVPGVPGTGYRSYGSSVLVPNVGRRPAEEDKIMILGGSQGTDWSANPPVPTNATDIVQVCNGYSGVGSSAWSLMPALKGPRMVQNTVLLPDGAILVIGGCKGTDYFYADWALSQPPPIGPGPGPVPEKRPEIYRKSVNAWVLQSPQLSERMYHSTAALLPSGKVVTAGGDIRLSDYEVFTPDYLASGQVRPAFASTIGPYLTFDTTYSIPYTPMQSGLHVNRVVLMRPCSVTHHSDMDQRYVELAEAMGIPPPNTIVVKTPTMPTSGTTQGSVVAPSGWYMMFLISNTGTPSIAQWIRLQ